MNECAFWPKTASESAAAANNSKILERFIRKGNGILPESVILP